MLLKTDSGDGQHQNGRAERITNALASLPVGRGLKRLAAEAFVIAKINELPLNSQQRREILPGGQPSLLNSFALLGDVSRELRMTFFEQVIERSLSPGKLKERPFLAAVLTQAGYWLHPDERRKLLVEISKHKPSGAVAKCWLALARSAKNLQEAQRLVKTSGRDTLLSCASRELKEFLVTVEVMHSLRKIRLPDKPSPHATQPEALLRRADQLKEVLLYARSVIAEHSWATGTTRYARFKLMVQEDILSLADRLESDSAPGVRNRALRAELERVGLELQFGKSLTRDPTRYWSEAELKVVRSALEVTGEYRNICSAVFEIRRAARLDGACGELSSCGTEIRLEDRCFALGKDATRVRGGVSPEEVVIHELGHGSSMIPMDILMKRAHKIGGANVNEWFCDDHFPEIFLRLGRWGGVTKRNEGYHVDDSGRATVNGKQFPLGVPVNIQGEVRVYQEEPAYRCLFWYAYPLGEFPQRADGRTDPTEQLTEGFTDYYRAPENLIEHAPHLFWYFESIYHRYDGEQNINERLRERLKIRTALVPQQIPVEVDAFSLLQRSEQLELLQASGLTLRRWQKVPPQPEERERTLLRACIRGGLPRVISKHLMSALSSYNPALLMARTYLFKGEDVALVSIRGSSSNDRDTQDLLRAELRTIFGSRLNRDQIFLLGDVKKSSRFATTLYHEKLVTLIAERLIGLATHGDGQHKRLKSGYDRAVLYTDMLPTVNYVNNFCKNKSISDAISVVCPRDTGSGEAAKLYLKATPHTDDGDSRTLHIFTVEDILALQAKFYVRLKDSERPLKEISLKDFLLKPDAKHWIKVTAGQSRVYSQRDLFFDDRNFSSEEVLMQLLKEGRQEGLMLKAYASE